MKLKIYTILGLLFSCLYYYQPVFSEEVQATYIGKAPSETAFIPVSTIRGHVSKQTGQYILGPGDKLSIKVRDLEKYDQEFTILPDGSCSIHPFGQLLISGSDLQALQDLLVEKFKFYLLKPEVTVNVLEKRPAIVYVLGAVNEPGIYQFVRENLDNHDKVEITLANVLKSAGGLTHHADIDHITVHHTEADQKETFDLRQFLKAGFIDDVWLRPGDRVYVPSMEHPMDPETFSMISQSTFYGKEFPVLVMGAVNEQGEIQINSRNNTLDAAIALAGGFSRGIAKKKHAFVRRRNHHGGFNDLTVERQKFDFPLQPGDIIYIADSKAYKGKSAMKALINIATGYFLGAQATQALQNVINK